MLATRGRPLGLAKNSRSTTTSWGLQNTAGEDRAAGVWQLEMYLTLTHPPNESIPTASRVSRPHGQGPLRRLSEPDCRQAAGASDGLPRLLGRCQIDVLA